MTSLDAQINEEMPRENMLAAVQRLREWVEDEAIGPEDDPTGEELRRFLQTLEDHIETPGEIWRDYQAAVWSVFDPDVIADSDGGFDHHVVGDAGGGNDYA